MHRGMAMTSLVLVFLVLSGASKLAASPQAVDPPAAQRRKTTVHRRVPLRTIFTGRRIHRSTPKWASISDCSNWPSAGSTLLVRSAITACGWVPRTGWT